MNNVINTGSEAIKLCLYIPPHHKDGIIHPTQADAEDDTTDVFDGKTIE